MTHVGQTSDVSGLPVPAPDQPDLRTGRGGQANALPPRPAAHQGRPQRISQIARCCGSNYWRWRYPNSPFPARANGRSAGHTNCAHCGKKLRWRTTDGTAASAHRRSRQRKARQYRALGLNSRGDQYKRHPNFTDDAQRRERALKLKRERYYRRRDRRAASGLTSRGTPRKRRENMPPGPARDAVRRQLAIDNYYAKRERFLDQGLTTTGRQRRRHLSTVPTDKERAWRQFRATLGISSSDFLSPLERAERL